MVQQGNMGENEHKVQQDKGKRGNATEEGQKDVGT